MKLLSRDFTPSGAGSFMVIAEGDDDLWFIYNRICEGDWVSTDTSRKVHHTVGIKGSTATRIKLSLELKVVSKEYDEKACVLRIRGKTTSPNSCVNAGAYHTLEIKPGLSFERRKKIWKKPMLEEVEQQSSASVESSHLVVILIANEELANIYLVGKGGSVNHCDKVEEIAQLAPQQQQQRKRNTNVACDKVEDSTNLLSPQQQRKKKVNATPTPVKRSSASATSSKFFESLLQSFLKHVEFNTTKYVVIASTHGKLKDNFHKYLLAEAQRLKLNTILANKSRLLLVNTASKNVKEIVDLPAVKKFIEETEEVENANVLDDFTETLATDENRACYGWKCVDMANTFVAIETLLVTDDLFKSSDAVIRKLYSSLVDSVKKSGGSTRVFPASSESGVKLAQVTGVAAILRFPIPNLDDLVL